MRRSIASGAPRLTAASASVILCSCWSATATRRRSHKPGHGSVACFAWSSRVSSCGIHGMPLFGSYGRASGQATHGLLLNSHGDHRGASCPRPLLAARTVSQPAYEIAADAALLGCSDSTPPDRSGTYFGPPLV